MANAYGDTGGGDGTGGTGGSGDPFLDQIKAAIPDIPDNLAQQMADILRGDPSEAGMNRAFSFLRGTDWFNTAYAGFNQGASSGLFNGSLEGLGQYRGWRTQVGDVYKQYYGRDFTAAELIDYASRGFDAGTIGQIGQGHSLAMSNSPDWNYYSGAFDTAQFTDAEKQAYGELLSGRSSALGVRVQARIQAAMAKASKLFEGVLAQGSAGQTAGFSPALSGNQQKSDIGA